MVALAISDDLLIGFVLGLAAGLLIAPFVRAWLIWSEATSAQREDVIARRLMERMVDHASAASSNGSPTRATRVGDEVSTWRQARP